MASYVTGGAKEKLSQRIGLYDRDGFPIISGALVGGAALLFVAWLLK